MEIPSKWLDVHEEGEKKQNIVTLSSINVLNWRRVEEPGPKNKRCFLLYSSHKKEIDIFKH